MIKNMIFINNVSSITKTLCKNRIENNKNILQNLYFKNQIYTFYIVLTIYQTHVILIIKVIFSIYFYLFVELILNYTCSLQETQF